MRPAPAHLPVIHGCSGGAGLLRQIGNVETLDYPYMKEGRARPDPLPRLVAAHRHSLEAVKKKARGQIVLIVKSMGGRVGCHVALDTKVHSVVCLGYPLCGGGDPSKMRDEVLLKSTAPIMLVQGTRDSFCPLLLLEKVRIKMHCPNKLVVVQGGNHSLEVTKRQLKLSGESQNSVDARILDSIAAFAQPTI